MRDVDVVVVGAGVVGLAAAASLARAGRSVLVVERDAGIARGVTSRNSEVVHAGIYYPPGSLKAELCVQGRERLYAWCAEHRVPHRKLGKLIVAAEEDEIPRLEALHEGARANGVPGLALLDRADVARLEPAVRAHAALLSPETGIVDGHALCLSLLAEAERHGASLLLHHVVVSLERTAEDWLVGARAGDGAETQTVRCGAVVNAAGLDSDRVAALAGIDVDAAGYRIHYCKGDYFALDPGADLALSHLVYPVPAGPGLGVHATLDLAGGIRFGPDAEYVAEIDYRVDPAKASAFATAVQRYLPDVRAERLHADYAGIRPRLAPPGEPFRDFVVAEESDRGLPGLVSCVGLESPGLTAALAVGDRIASLL